MKPINLERLIEALEDITDDDTTGVCIITTSDTEIRARSFGDQTALVDAVRETSEALLPN